MHDVVNLDPQSGIWRKDMPGFSGQKEGLEEGRWSLSMSQSGWQSGWKFSLFFSLRYLSFWLQEKNHKTLIILPTVALRVLRIKKKNNKSFWMKVMTGKKEEVLIDSEVRKLDYFVDIEHLEQSLSRFCSKSRGHACANQFVALSSTRWKSGTGCHAKDFTATPVL